MKSVRDLHCRTNVLLSRFSFCTPDVRYKLFKAHCVVAYGCQLWDYQSVHVQKFFTAWRKCVRRVWGIPNTTHCNLLPGICEDRGIEAQLLSRVLNFIRKSVVSCNSLLNCCSQLALRGSFSAVSNTVAKLADELSVSRDLLAWSPYRLFDGPSGSETAGAIRDFVIARHSSAGDDRAAFDDIINFLCTE